jgi:heme-degrading monooxygenase HmoA
MSTARIAVYDLTGSYEAVVTKVRDGLVPLYQQQAGFESFFSVEGNNNNVVSVSLWNDEQAATNGASVVQAWVRDNISADQLKLRDTVIGDITKY